MDIRASEPGSSGIFDGNITAKPGKSIPETTKELVETLRPNAISRILVVCPASVLFTWRREIWKWQTLGLSVFLIQAGRDRTISQGLIGWGANGRYIINHDILGDYPEIKSANRGIC